MTNDNEGTDFKSWLQGFISAIAIMIVLYSCS
jgi:hypothetical protein